jgi:hypothetical protein
MRLLSGIVALLMIFAVTTGLGTPPPAAEAATCADFPTQAVAQSYLRDNPSDPDGLDADGDGIACESNPCPCDLSPVRRAAIDATATPRAVETPAPQPQPGESTPAAPSPEKPGEPAPSAKSPDKPGEAKATAPAIIDPRTGMRVVVVSVDVYNTVAAAYVEGRDAGEVYRSLTGAITPPSTGDGGLAAR